MKLTCERCQKKTEHRKNGKNTFRAGKTVQTWQCKTCGRNQYLPIEPEPEQRGCGILAGSGVDTMMQHEPYLNANARYIRSKTLKEVVAMLKPQLQLWDNGEYRGWIIPEKTWKELEEIAK